MKVTDIPKDWRNTGKGIWHRPTNYSRNGVPHLEWKIYYEQTCLRCKSKYVTPQPRRPYCTKLCANRAIAKFGKAHRRWNNGRANIASGYILVLVSRKPRRYCFEHRLIMEKKIGRTLTPNEVVHHINGIRNDNRLDNLILMTRAKHASHHHSRKSKKSSS